MLFSAYANAGVISVDFSGMEYRVEPRDSLWSICKQFCEMNNLATTKTIAKINTIRNVRKISIGKRIRIPREYIGFTIAVKTEPIAVAAVSDATTSSDAAKTYVSTAGTTIQELQSALESAKEQSEVSQRSAAELTQSLEEEKRKSISSVAAYSKFLRGVKIAAAVLILMLMGIIVVGAREFLARKQMVYLKFRLELGKLEDRLGIYRFGTKRVSKEELIKKVEKAIKACLIRDGTPVSEDQEAVRKLADEGVLVFE